MIFGMLSIIVQHVVILYIRIASCQADSAQKMSLVKPSVSCDAVNVMNPLTISLGADEDDGFTSFTTQRIHRMSSVESTLRSDRSACQKFWGFVRDLLRCVALTYLHF